MKTKILLGDDLSEAVQLLQRGEPVVFPTETVYGLGAPLFLEEAVRKIFSIKGRPSDNPLIAHISQLSQVAELGENIPDFFYLLAEKFWPGPLTLVVKRKETVPSLVSAGQPTLAIRMPAHPIARRLIEEVGSPLVAPSANLSGRPSPTCLRDVLEDLDGKVQLAIDGGPCQLGIESTVLSLYHPVPTLLRPGSITQEMLGAVLQVKIALPAVDGPIFSPGMKYRHYAPRAPVKLIYKPEELTAAFILSSVVIQGRPTHFLSAQTLYAALREADRMGAPEIQIYCDSTVLLDAALMNRLLRASGLY